MSLYLAHAEHGGGRGRLRWWVSGEAVLICFNMIMNGHRAALFSFIFALLTARAGSCGLWPIWFIGVAEYLVERCVPIAPDSALFY